MTAPALPPVELTVNPDLSAQESTVVAESDQPNSAVRDAAADIGRVYVVLRGRKTGIYETKYVARAR